MGCRGANRRDERCTVHRRTYQIDIYAGGKSRYLNETTGQACIFSSPMRRGFLKQFSIFAFHSLNWPQPATPLVFGLIASTMPLWTRKIVVIRRKSLKSFAYTRESTHRAEGNM